MHTQCKTTAAVRQSSTLLNNRLFLMENGKFCSTQNRYPSTDCQNFTLAIVFASNIHVPGLAYIRMAYVQVGKL